MRDSITSFRALGPGALLLLLLLSGSVAWCSSAGPAAAASGQADAASPRPAQAEPDVAALREDVARLKRLVPSQSHAMQDVGYHFTNLWFAGQKGNWPLAAFYLAETRSHLKWAVRIIPVRKTQAGEVDLEGIRETVDNSSLADVQKAIEAKDVKRFAGSYKLALEGCYSCHKASEKPFLRPRVPSEPEVRIMNFDPTAKWPE